MGERFGRAGRWLWTLLLFPFQLIGRLLGKPGQWLLVVGRWLWVRLLALVSRFWRFLGRMGLALRNLLTWFVWKPLLLLTIPIWLPGRWLWDYLKVIAPPVWRFTGRMGLALRYLLARFVWRPLRLVASLFHRFYRWAIRPLLLWLARLVWGWLTWLAGAVRAFIRARWQAGAPRRALFRRRFASRWRLFRARWRVAMRRPQPPVTAVIAPHLPPATPTNTRLIRFATAFISIGIVLAVSLISLQERQPGSVAAGSSFFATRIVVITPSPGPPTPTPRPTIEVKLTPWATPDPLNQGGSIAFTLRQNGNSDIYVLPIGQAEPIRLTAHPAADRDPAWSPDGREIAFASRRDGNWEIYVYNLPAGELRRITHNLAFDGSPGWSPDGQWLVYESYRDDNLDIYIVKADLSEGPFRLTENPAPDFAPVWSPGGRHIAFTSWRSGNKDIFLMSLDEITDEAAANVTASPAEHEDAPAFSPDGRYLAYHAESSDLGLIYALPLTEDYTVAAAPISLGQQGRQPAWSPDSQSVIYVVSQGERDYLMAGRPDAWGVTPQTYAADGRIDTPSWSAVTLTPELAANLRNIDPTARDKPLFVEALAPPEKNQPPVLLWELAVNAPSPYLSDRVDQSFLALRERLAAEAGWDVLGQLDNMFEAIDGKPLPGQTERSWNKAGRAFDLYYRDALAFEPQVEVIRVDLGTETYWRVYVRTAAQDGRQGEPLRALPWDFRARYGDEPQYYDQGGKWKDDIPGGYYVDFTALAADYGWTWVPSGANWRTYFPDVRFWHYENRQGLSWEAAMLELYLTDEFSGVFGEP